MALGFLSILCFRTAFACPSACGTYYVYYVVVASGFNKDAVITQGEDISKILGDTLILDGADSTSRLKQCESEPDRCMALVSSDDELIGKTSKTTYAVAYLFHSYKTEENRKKAKILLRRIRKTARDAYLKPIVACACE